MTTTTPRKRAARRPRTVTEVVDVPVAVEPEPVDAVAEPDDLGSVLEPDDAADDAGAAPDVAAGAPADPSAKYVARKKLTFKGKVYQPGEPVPGAEQINRIETWVVHGYLKEA